MTEDPLKAPSADSFCFPRAKVLFKQAGFNGLFWYGKRLLDVDTQSKVLLDKHLS